jgi:hypothetical protein
MTVSSLADILNNVSADYDRINRDFTIALAFADPRPQEDDLGQVPLLQETVTNHVAGPWALGASAIPQLDDVLPEVLEAYREAMKQFGFRETLYTFARLLQLGHIQTYESPWDVPEAEAEIVSAALLDRHKHPEDDAWDWAFS